MVNLEIEISNGLYCYSRISIRYGLLYIFSIDCTPKLFLSTVMYQGFRISLLWLLYHILMLISLSCYDSFSLVYVMCDLFVTCYTHSIVYVLHYVLHSIVCSVPLLSIIVTGLIIVSCSFLDVKSSNSVCFQ